MGGNDDHPQFAVFFDAVLAQRMYLALPFPSRVGSIHPSFARGTIIFPPHTFPIFPSLPFPCCLLPSLLFAFLVQNLADVPPLPLSFPHLIPSKQAQSNLTLLNTIVWGTCNTDPSETQCMGIMQDLATTLQDVCATEMREQNALVEQTLTGAF